MSDSATGVTSSSTSRATPPPSDATEARNSTPKASKRRDTASVAPDSANTKTPSRSSASKGLMDGAAAE